MPMNASALPKSAPILHEHSWVLSWCRIFLTNACWHAVIIRNSLESVIPLIQSPSIFGETIVEYYPTREGELLSVIAIEHQIITLIGGGGHHYRARYIAAEDGSEVDPLRPADILGDFREILSPLPPPSG